MEMVGLVGKGSAVKYPIEVDHFHAVFRLDELGLGDANGCWSAFLQIQDFPSGAPSPVGS